MAYNPYTGEDDTQPINLANNLNNQMAFVPGSKKDILLNTMYEGLDTYKDTPAYRQLREQDVEGFNEGKWDLSLPKDQYKGIEGYTARVPEEMLGTMSDATYFDEYNAPNYLGSRSPITYPSQRPNRLYRRGDTSGLTQNLGLYGKHGQVFDPAFGELGQTDFWDTAYPGHFKAKGYYDEYDEIPRLQRDDFYENFKDQGIAGLDVEKDINTTDKWITPVEGARTIIENPDYIPPEGWRLPATDFGPVRRTEPLPPRGRLDRFLQRFGVPPMTQVSAADKLANKQFMQEQGIGRDPQTGRMIGGDFAGKNAPGTSAWGSANFGEMATKWDEDYGDMVYKTDKMKQKQIRMKQLAAQHAQKVAADRQERIRNQRAAANAANQMTQRRPGMGGSHMSRSVGQGGLGISASQAQAVSDANRAAGMGGWNLAQGGRVGYKTGGRVGILGGF